MKSFVFMGALALAACGGDEDVDELGAGDGAPETVSSQTQNAIAAGNAGPGPAVRRAPISQHAAPTLGGGDPPTVLGVFVSPSGDCVLGTAAGNGKDWEDDLDKCVDLCGHSEVGARGEWVDGQCALQCDCGDGWVTLEFADDATDMGGEWL